jgi:hypothetical protein
MKYLVIIFASIFILNVNAYAQTPSKKMMELEKICLSLRNGMGSERSVTQGYHRLEGFQKRNSFVYSESDVELISGDEYKVPLDGHMIYIPQYFKTLLETKDGVFKKGEELLDEWNELHKAGNKGLGNCFRQHHFAIKANSSMTFRINVPKGLLDLLVVAEPNAFVTMKVYDATSNVHLITQEDLIEEKTGKPSRRKTMKLDRKTCLNVTVSNVSSKDASMALFWF